MQLQTLVSFTHFWTIQYAYSTPITLLAILILYFLYLLKFKFYYYYEKMHFSKTRASLIRGTPPPSYPNGWYRLCESKRLSNSKPMSIKVSGRHVALFRGEDGVAYAVNAFCTHMGANLANGGKVKWGRCIECPFHGWTFDGKTGKCVNSSGLEEKTVSHHVYHDINNMTKKDEKYIVKDSTCTESKVEVYEVREINGMVYVWLHSRKVPP